MPLLFLIGCGRAPSPPMELGLLKDPGGRMGIEEAAAPETEGRYRLQRDHRMSLGFSRSALWVRIPLQPHPQGAVRVLTVAAPWMDRIDLFLAGRDGPWRRQSTGMLQPGPSAAVGGYALTASLDNPGQGHAYLRLQSVLALNADIGLITIEEFERRTLVFSHIYGGLYGIMGAMFLVNLIVFLVIRDRAYLYYILYLISIIGHQFCLQGQILLLPMEDWPYIGHLSLAFSSLLLFFGAAFCRRFLDTRTNAPLADRLLLAAQILSGLLLLLALSGRLWWGTWLTHSMALFGPVIAIAAGVRAMGRGMKAARFYLLAWFILLLGGMAWGAWSMGLDWLRPPQMTITLAAALESILLTLALAERLRLIQKERLVLVQRERRYHQLSITDELTGLYNHRHFWSKMNVERDRANQTGRPLSLVLLDLDDFKRLNDTHGHAAGDRVLAETGLLLKQCVRPADAACRYGGEEFALILPMADGRAAGDVAERVRSGLEKLEIRIPDGPVLHVTASLGTAGLEPEDDPQSLFDRADQALYQAKTEGKNRVAQG